MTETSKCAVCGKDIMPADFKDHLTTNHLGPHYFWCDGRKFRTMEPSMTGARIKALANASSGYQMFREQEGGDIPVSDGVAEDLTREPHFYAVPPATIWG
jgi:hypothetical protein